jgi:hypothetical protein
MRFSWAALALASAFLHPCPCRRPSSPARRSPPSHSTGRLSRLRPSGPRGCRRHAHQQRHLHQGALVPGVLRILVDITAPADARAHILLEMRPSGPDAVRIAHPGDKALAVIPFEKWADGPLGPGFSYEDFLEQQYFWPGQAALESVRRGARDCDVLKSTPGATDKTITPRSAHGSTTPSTFPLC